MSIPVNLVAGSLADEAYLRKIEQDFLEDFVINNAYYLGRLVTISKKINNEGYNETFYHIVSKEDENDKKRYFNMDRCCRCHWVKPIIENSNKDIVLCWEKPGKRNTSRIFLYLENAKYIVVLHKDKKDRIYLTTAYYVEGKYNNKKFKKEYSKYNS